MKLYSTRHGESVLNDENKVSGMTDIPLTDCGVRQAETLARQMADVPIDLIVSSPLMRAVRTAQIVAEAKGMPVVLDDRLKEQNYGIFELGSRTNAAFQAARDSFAYRIPSGESMFLVIQRVYNFLDELKQRCSRQSVLLVSHSAICRAIHSYCVDQTDEEFLRFRCKNCECKEYEL